MFKGMFCYEMPQEILNTTLKWLSTYHKSEQRPSQVHLAKRDPRVSPDYNFDQS